MVAAAKDEHDFKEAVDTLYLVYMESRDPENPAEQAHGLQEISHRLLVGTIHQR